MSDQQYSDKTLARCLQRHYYETTHVQMYMFGCYCIYDHTSTSSAACLMIIQCNNDILSRVSEDHSHWLSCQWRHTSAKIKIYENMPSCVISTCTVQRDKNVCMWWLITPHDTRYLLVWQRQEHLDVESIIYWFIHRRHISPWPPRRFGEVAVIGCILLGCLRHIIHLPLEQSGSPQCWRRHSRVCIAHTGARQGSGW